MGLIELRLGDEDHKEYAPEGAPEWVPLDRDALDIAPFDVLNPLEREIRRTDKTSIQKLIYEEFQDTTALGIKAAIWLSWKMSGIDTPPWDDFNIRTNEVRWRMEDDGDADPPASGSSEPSPTDETTTPSLESSPS